MRTPIEKVLKEFCELSKLQKEKKFSVYQEKLETAYKGERVLRLPINNRGLEEMGGRLLEGFLQQHPYIEEIHLKGNKLNLGDADNITNPAGFDAFLSGLEHTKTANKLRVLDLSNAFYSVEQMQRLAKNVLMGHPSFTTLKLSTAYFTDQHLDAMLPYLSCPKLKKLMIDGNDGYLIGDASIFNRFIDKLLQDCPSIQYIDISANTAITENSPAAEAFLRLVTTNKQTFVQIPRALAVSNQSMRNRYEHFIPNQFTLIELELNKIKQFTHSGINLQSLTEMLITVREHEERHKQIDKRFAAISEQCEQAQQQMLQSIHFQCLKQILVEKQLGSINADTREFKANIQAMKIDIQTTQMSIHTMNEHMENIAGDNTELTKTLEVLKAKQAEHTDALENIEIHMENELAVLRKQFDGIEAKLQSQWAKISTEELDADLSPVEQAYIKKFKYMIVQMYIVATAATEGSLQLGSTGPAGTAATVLNILSNIAPTGGGALTMFAYLLQTADETIAKKRMTSITQLGTAPDEVANLALQLSRRLIHCFTLEHHIKKGTLTKLLSITKDTMQLFTQNRLYGALFHVVQDDGVLTPLTNAVKQAVTIPEIEVRAEQDAKLLLKTIVKTEAVPKRAGEPDLNRLFLYATPLLTVIDRLFLTMLQQFYTSQHCDNNLSISTEKKQRFYGEITKSWHNHAEVVAEQIEISGKREKFITMAATNFTTRQHPDGTVGIFYFKSGQTLFNRTPKTHVSIRDEALKSTEVEEVISNTLMLL